MSDRLPELQRQRALIQGHLAWLEQEIAAASGRPASQATHATTAPQPVNPSPAVTPAQDENPEAIIAEYNSDPKGTVESMRNGCFRWFTVALVLLLLSMYGLYRYSVFRKENKARTEVKSAPPLPTER